MAIFDPHSLRKLADQRDLPFILRRLAEIDEEATKLLHHNRLFDWQISWVPNMGCLGETIPDVGSPSHGVILMRCNPEDLAGWRDVFIHEIAHALTTGEEDPHGPLWAAKYAELRQLHNAQFVR